MLPSMSETLIETFKYPQPLHWHWFKHLNASSDEGHTRRVRHQLCWCRWFSCLRWFPHMKFSLCMITFPGEGAHTAAADLPPGWWAGQAALAGRAPVRGHGQATQHHHVPVRGQPAPRRHRHPEARRENEIWRDRGRFKFTIVSSENAVKYYRVSIYSILFLSCRKYYLI